MTNKNTFNIIYQKNLNDKIILDSFISGFEQGLKKAEEGIPFWSKDAYENKENKENDKNKQTQNIGFKNPPKVGEILILNSNNSTKRITAKVLSKINEKGQWGIILINKDPNNLNYLYYSDIYPDGIITSPQFMKKTHKKRTDFDSIEGPYEDLYVGFGTPFSSWTREKDMLANY